MSLSTHILDTATGVPAAGVPVELFGAPDPAGPDDPTWQLLGRACTDADGRAVLTPADRETTAGHYRLRFHIDQRLAQTPPGAVGDATPVQAPSFYPWVDVTVHTPPVAHLHVPLLLSPFGYTTYRGS